MSSRLMFVFFALLRQSSAVADTPSAQALTLAERALSGTTYFETTPTPSVPSPQVTRTRSCEEVSGLCYDCRLYANGIGLNSWYSSHYLQTYAIVTQTFIQYNDVLSIADAETNNVPDASTLLGHYDANAPPTNVVGLPTDLVPGSTQDLDYGYSYLETATIFSIDGARPTAIASPTAWTQGTGTITAAYTVYSDGTSLLESTAELMTDASCDATFVQTASDANQTYSGTIVADMPQSMYQEIISYWKTIPDTNWSLASCTRHNSMGGEPTVHIPVSQLTVTSSTTRTINQNAPVGYLSADQTLQSDTLPTTPTSNLQFNPTASTASASATGAASAGAMVRCTNCLSSYILVAAVSLYLVQR